MNQADQNIGLSIEAFNHQVQTLGWGGLGVCPNGPAPGSLIDCHVYGREFSQNGSSNQGGCLEILCAEVSQRLFSELESEVYEHPKFLQMEQLAARVVEDGWDHESEVLFKEEIARATLGRERLDQMYLSSREWTEQTAVADYLLSEGTALYLEALLTLEEALDTATTSLVEESLAWLGEGIFYLMAVQQWRADCEQG